MFCTNCGKEIDNGTLFCIYCGGKQEQASSAVPDEKEKVSEENQTTDNNEQIATESGVTEIPDDDKPNDNNLQPVQNTVPVTSAPTYTKPVPPGDDSKKSSSFGIIAVIAVVLILAAVFLFSGKSSGYKDYKDLAADYYNAIYKADFNALLKCYDKEDQKDMKDDRKDYVDDLKDVKEDFEDRFDKGWQKEIDVKTRNKQETDDDVTTYMVTVEIDNDGYDYVGIKKYKNRYYIDSSNDAF